MHDQDAAAFDGAFTLDDEFDPLAVDDADIDQENMDDDNPYDTIDYPTMRNMPEEPPATSVYTPERLGSAHEAIAQLMDRNPARRQAFMAILDLCREGCRASVVSERVQAVQQDNRSVYAPMTLCRILERAGALALEMPEVTDEREDVGEGVQYLEVRERIDPVWRTTDAGLAAYDEQLSGSTFRDLVLNQDARYLPVYAAVMDLIDDAPRKTAEVTALVDTFDIVQSPRRYGTHFLDVLERADAIAWKDHAWTLTDLGRQMRDEVEVGLREGVSAQAGDGSEPNQEQEQ